MTIGGRFHSLSLHCGFPAYTKPGLSSRVFLCPFSGLGAFVNTDLSSPVAALTPSAKLTYGSSAVTVFMGFSNSEWAFFFGLVGCVCAMITTAVTVMRFRQERRNANKSAG